MTILADKLAALPHPLPPDLLTEILDVDRRATDLEDLYHVHTAHDDGRHRIDLRIYVNGRPTGAGTLTFDDPDPPAPPLTTTILEDAVRDLQLELDDLWLAFVARLSAALEAIPAKSTT